MRKINLVIDRLIDLYGKQAYHEAIKQTVFMVMRTSVEKNSCWRCKQLWDHIHEVGYVCGILTVFNKKELVHIRDWINWMLRKKTDDCNVKGMKGVSLPGRIP